MHFFCLWHNFESRFGRLPFFQWREKKWSVCNWMKKHVSIQFIKTFIITTYNFTRRQFENRQTDRATFYLKTHTQTKNVFRLHLKILNQDPYEFWNQTHAIHSDRWKHYICDNYMVASVFKGKKWYLLILGSHMSEIICLFVTINYDHYETMRVYRHYGNGHYLISCIFQMQTNSFSWIQYCPFYSSVDLDNMVKNWF